MTAEFILNRPESRQGEPNEAGGDVYVTLASGAQTSGGYFLTHALVPPGGGPPAHTHTREEEAFYVIRGELSFLAGDDEVVAGPGTFVNIPRGMKHRFRNESDVEAELIFWFAPAEIEGLFAELAEAPERLLEIGERYGTSYHLEE